MTRFSFFVILAFLALVARPANSACDSVELLREYGEKHFKPINDGGDSSVDSLRKSSFKLPNANSCLLRIDSRTLSSITCEWLIVKGFANKAEATRTYEDLLQSLLKCVRRPETLERRSVKRFEGERAYMLDSFPGIKATQRRSFELTYRYQDYWWSVDLNYEVNDDATP